MQRNKILNAPGLLMTGFAIVFTFFSQAAAQVQKPRLAVVHMDYGDLPETTQLKVDSALAGMLYEIGKIEVISREEVKRRLQEKGAKLDSLKGFAEMGRVLEVDYVLSGEFKMNFQRLDTKLNLYDVAAGKSMGYPEEPVGTYAIDYLFNQEMTKIAQFISSSVVIPEPPSAAHPSKSRKRWPYIAGLAAAGGLASYFLLTGGPGQLPAPPALPRQ